MPSQLGFFLCGIFGVLLWMNWGVFSPQGLQRVLVTLFLCCLSIRLFCYDLSVPIFCSKIVLLPSNPFASIFSIILYVFAGRIFLLLFWKVLFCLDCLILSWYFFSLPSLTCAFWFISSSRIFYSDSVVLLSSSQRILAFLLCISFFACCHQFLISVTSQTSHTHFDFLYVLFMGTPTFFID